MQAVKFIGGGAELTEVEASPEPGLVRVDVAAAGLCGSDIGFLAAGLDVTPGHEYSGVTEDGRLVAVQPNAHCGSCAHCGGGHSNLCSEAFARFAGMAGQHGGLATSAYVDPSQLHFLPEGMPVEAGALAEPAAVAGHAVGLLDAALPGPRVVVGGGTIGLLAGLIMTERGDEVTVIGRYRHQREAAEKLGLRYSETYTGPAPTAVLDSAGSQSSMDFAIDELAPQGVVVTLGTNPWEPRLKELFLYKELVLRSSIIYTREDFAEAVAFVHRNPGVYDAVVTHHFSLAEAVAAVDTARARGESGSIKVLVHP